jgi:hypothetical protein
MFGFAHIDDPVQLVLYPGKLIDIYPDEIHVCIYTGML